MLLGTIGTFPEEDQAFQFVTKLSWAIPLTLLIGSILDAFFVVIFMKFAHPWKGILEEIVETEVSPNVEPQEVPETNEVP